jgi:hypothetical protein
MDDLLTYAAPLLAASLARWQHLVSTAAPELLRRQPAPGAWSALECLQHLLDVEELVFPVRLPAFLAGGSFPDFDPAQQGRPLPAEASPADVVAAFAEWRTNTLSLLAQLASADLARSARHGGLGPVTLDQFLHEWVAHDLMHLVQAERALLQPFIQGSGPWRPFFADYEAGPAA